MPEIEGHGYGRDAWGFHSGDGCGDSASIISGGGGGQGAGEHGGDDGTGDGSVAGDTIEGA